MARREQAAQIIRDTMAGPGTVAGIAWDAAEALDDAGLLAARGQLAAIERLVFRLEAWCRDETRDDGQALGGIVADLRRAADGGPHDE